MKIDNILFLISFSSLFALHLGMWIVKLNFKANFKEKTRFKLPYDAAQVAKNKNIQVLDGMDFFAYSQFNKMIINEEVISGNTIYDFIYVEKQVNDKNHNLLLIKVINNYFSSLSILLFLVLSWFGMAELIIGASIWGLSILTTLIITIVSHVNFKKHYKEIYQNIKKDINDVNESFDEVYRSSWNKVSRIYFWNSLTSWNQILYAIAELLYGRTKHFKDRKM